MTARTLTDIIDADRSTRLELVVVLLIIAEILLTIGQPVLAAPSAHETAS